MTLRMIETKMVILYLYCTGDRWSGAGVLVKSGCKRDFSEALLLSKDRSRATG